MSLIIEEAKTVREIYTLIATRLGDKQFMNQRQYVLAQVIPVENTHSKQ